MGYKISQNKNRILYAKTGPGGHVPDGTGPYGRGDGPGNGQTDGSGMEKNDRFPYDSIDEATTDLSNFFDPTEAGQWAQWLWDMSLNGELAKARCVIFNIISKFISIVKGPAVESSTWLMKSKDTVIADCKKKFVPYLKPIKGNKQSLTTYNKTIIYAAVLEPNITDANGELYPPWEVEKTAHLFMRDYNAMDNNHDYIAGSGTVLESWVPKEKTIMQTFNGEVIEYEPFTWFIGFEPSPYEADLIKKGERDGLSIGGEWPKIIFTTPGVKKMNEDEKEFFADLLVKNQEKTADLLTKQAEVNKELFIGVSDGITKGLEPLSGIKSVLEQIKSTPEVPPQVDGNGGTPAPVTAVPAVAPVVVPPTPEPAPVQAVTPAPADVAPVAEAGIATPVAEVAVPDETPDQKVARISLELTEAQKMVEIRQRAIASQGSPTGDLPPDDSSDLNKAWIEHQKLGSKVKTTRSL